MVATFVVGMAIWATMSVVAYNDQQDKIQQTNPVVVSVSPDAASHVGDTAKSPNTWTDFIQSK